MTDQNRLKLIYEYLRQHKKGLLLFFLFALIYAVVFSMYTLEVEAVLYSMALCLAAGGVICGLDFAKYVSRHKRMQELSAQISLGLRGLPEAQNLVEQDYEMLLKGLQDEKNRIATAADQERSDMLDYYTLWAHQIKTPIAAMRILLQQEDSDLSRELEAQLFQVSRYVEMVLSYLRLEGDTTDFMFGRHSLEELVRKEVRRYAPLFVRKRLGLDLKEMNVPVLTDEKWLRFVIGQVLSNSLKYTVRGKITIYAEGKTLVIEDTGIGIAPEDIPRLGQKGFTGANGRRDQKATGLGLYLCRQVLTKLGHSMAIFSEPGKGTQVRICLQEAKLRTE